MSRRYEERNAEARAKLEPLEPGERPRAVTAGAIVSAVLAVIFTVSAVLAVAGVDAGGRDIKPLPIVTFAVVFWVMAVGMWRARYWAVLGFQTLLLLMMLASAFGLVVVELGSPGRRHDPAAARIGRALLFHDPRDGAYPDAVLARSGLERFYRVELMAEYDVIVIGGGPGGYVAAIRAAQLGQKTAVVERDKAGGRCLNYACIPAKTVLHTAQIFVTVTEDGADLGIKSNGTSIDWKALQERRTKVSKTLEDGVQFLWNKNKVEFLHGEASLAGGGKVKVGDDEHQAKAIVLATGSVALPIPGVDFSDRVIDTWGAYSLESMPKSLVIAGAGASGSEIASAYSRMGVEVTLIEMLDQILPLEDKDMARVVERQFKKDGMEVLTGTKVESVEEQKSGVKVKAGDKEIKADYLVIAGGRRPDTDPLNLDAAGVKTNDRGQIEIDEYQRTSADGVFAIGDLVRGPALAHKAEEEGVVAVETAAGHETEAVNIDLVPGATFTHPQVASVGMTEEQAKEAGRQIKVGKFKLGGAGASVVYDDRAGLVKIVGDPEYGEILGAHIVGNIACDMISEIVNVMALEGGYPELERIIHPHPTMSEAVLDGARAVDGWAIHA